MWEFRGYGAAQRKLKFWSKEIAVLRRILLSFTTILSLALIVTFCLCRMGLKYKRKLNLINFMDYFLLIVGLELGCALSCRDLYMPSTYNH